MLLKVRPRTDRELSRRLVVTYRELVVPLRELKKSGYIVWVVVAETGGWGLTSAGMRHLRGPVVFEYRPPGEQAVSLMFGFDFAIEPVLAVIRDLSAGAGYARDDDVVAEAERRGLDPHAARQSIEWSVNAVRCSRRHGEGTVAIVS